MSVSDPSSRPAPRSGLGRRELAGLAAAAAAAPVIGLVPAGSGAAAPGSARGAARSRLRLRKDPGSAVSALDVPLDLTAAGAARARPGRSVRTPVLETTGFAMLGVTWDGGAGVVRARARRVGGGWSGWRTLPALTDGPDPATAEARRTPAATAPVWFGRCDAVQIEMSGTARRPVLALIDPGTRPQDRIAARRTADDGPSDQPSDQPSDETRDPAGRPKKVPRPKIRLRRAWGPNPRLLNGKPDHIRTVKQIHVHHTVNGNDYRRKDVPGIIRAIYRYHTNNLGWADIGYNFLVDRFGRIWVGRKGSIGKKVQGAHTLGFNHCSVGVSVIGNFESGKPDAAVLDAIAKLAAWKLDTYDRDPTGRIRVVSRGSDKYRKGKRVRLPVIDGHRDTNDTACPGRTLYAELPAIRRRAARRMKRFG